MAYFKASDPTAEVSVAATEGEVTQVVIRTAYMPSYRGDDIDFGDEPSRTIQSMAADCDINNIMKNWEKTGIISHVNKYQGRYEDLSNAPTYHEAMNTVIEAQTAFMDLSAKVRARFNNDPEEFLAFVSDPENKAEMRELGLLDEAADLTPLPSVPTPVAPQGTEGGGAQSPRRGDVGLLRYLFLISPLTPQS